MIHFKLDGDVTLEDWLRSSRPQSFRPSEAVGQFLVDAIKDHATERKQAKALNAIIPYVTKPRMEDDDYQQLLFHAARYLGVTTDELRKHVE